MGRMKADYVQGLYRPFAEARNLARGSGARNRSDWRRLRATGQLPHDLPRDPQKHYQGSGWVSWADFLGLPEEED